jgi:hypothetical protein
VRQPGRAGSSGLAGDVEGRLRHAEIRTGPQLSIGERHAGGQNPDADLALPWLGNVVLHYFQYLGAAEVIDNDALHRLLSVS